MPICIRIPLALELLFLALEHAWSGARSVLPIGGNGFVQLAILLCFGIALGELFHMTRRRGRKQNIENHQSSHTKRSDEESRGSV